MILFTVDFGVTSTAMNPYWPYDPSPSSFHPIGRRRYVDGLFSSDNWASHRYLRRSTIRIMRSSSRYVDVSLTRLSSRADKPAALGLLFAPDKVGQWKYKIRVTDSTELQSQRKNS